MLVCLPTILQVCYSFWVLSSLAILRRIHWIDAQALINFVLSAQVKYNNYVKHRAVLISLQDHEKGGIADRPEDVADVFHTQFGVAGLSLVGYQGLDDLDPVYCMPAEIIKKLGLHKNWLALPRRSG